MAKATKNARILFTVKGTVRNVYVEEESKKTVVNIWADKQLEDAIDSLVTAHGLTFNRDYPIKVDETTDQAYLKTKTNFNFTKLGIPSGFEMADIGAGSEVKLSIELKEVVFRRDKSISAYLRGIDVLHFEEADEADVFDVADISELVTFEETESQE